MDAERQWLELMGHVLAAPLTALPEERIAAALMATFDAPVCCFHARPDPHTMVLRIYPSGMFTVPMQTDWMHLTTDTPTGAARQRGSVAGNFDGALLDGRIKVRCPVIGNACPPR